MRRGAVFVLQVCSGRSGCRGPAVWSSLRTWTADVGGGCEVTSACWPESCRGCSYPGTVWGRLEDTRFKLLTVFTHITSKRGRKESTFIAGLDSFNTHSQSCPVSALLTSCGYSSCRRALAGWRGPAAARSCTRPGPRAGLCSEQHCCCPRCFPLSSASQHGSYSGPVLKHQQTAIIFLLIGVPTDLTFFYNLNFQTCPWIYLDHFDINGRSHTYVQVPQNSALVQNFSKCSLLHCSAAAEEALCGSVRSITSHTSLVNTMLCYCDQFVFRHSEFYIIEMSLVVFLHTRMISVLSQSRDTFRYLFHVDPCCS